MQPRGYWGAGGSNVRTSGGGAGLRLFGKSGNGGSNLDWEETGYQWGSGGAGGKGGAEPFFSFQAGAPGVVIVFWEEPWQ